jgi:hypothetical protein
MRSLRRPARRLIARHGGSRRGGIALDQRVHRAALLADTQCFIGRQHGFASWPRFSKHITKLRRSNSKISLFENAVEAIISGDIETLKNILEAEPDIIRARSTREQRSTLLHYVSANGVEDFRRTLAWRLH